MFSKDPQKRGYKICIYGVPGVGKSTMATFAPDPAFIDLEDGLITIDCLKTSYITEYETYMQAMRSAASNKDIKTIVIDTVDGLEKILTDRILKDHDKESLADFGYGKGYEILMNEFNKQFDVMDKISRMGKNIIIIAHDMVKTYQDPTSEPYDRYMIKLHQKSAQVLYARLDAVLFATYEKLVKKNKQNDQHRAIGKGKRILLCSENPAYIAKNRFGLDEKMEFSEDIFNQINEAYNHNV